MTAKHTSTPWTINPSAGLGVTIRAADGVKPVVEVWANGDDYAANAALIVRAVNSHDELMAAADEALNVLIGCCIPMHGDDDRNAILSVQQQLRVALAKAATPD